MFKEPFITHSYQFLSLIIDDDGSSILSGLVVKLYNRKRLKYCVMILLVARRQAIMMITTEVVEDKR